MLTYTIKLFLGILLSAQAFAAPPIIWYGASAKLLPSSLQSAGVCQLDNNGVLSSTAPGSSGNVLLSNGSVWTSSSISGNQEVPSGSINGTNVTFGLSMAPSAYGSFYLYKNGMILVQGVDYSVTGSTITMASPPLYWESLYATYSLFGGGGGGGGVSSINGASGVLSIAAGSNISVSTIGSTITITGTASPYTPPTEVQEAPSGLVNSSNVTFTLANTPVSNVSVKLYLNGIFQRQGTNYTISGATITMAVAPTTGQQLDANYAH